MMKVLLKQSGTGCFLKDRDQWTVHSEEAMDFKTTPAALDYSRFHGYRDMSIILRFLKSGEDLELERCC